MTAKRIGKQIQCSPQAAATNMAMRSIRGELSFVFKAWLNTAAGCGAHSMICETSCLFQQSLPSELDLLAEELSADASGSRRAPGRGSLLSSCQPRPSTAHKAFMAVHCNDQSLRPQTVPLP